MSEERTQEARNCSHCRQPIADGETGLRHYGTHTAHAEYRCHQLTAALIERQAAMFKAWKAARAALKGAK